MMKNKKMLIGIFSGIVAISALVFANSGEGYTWPVNAAGCEHTGVIEHYEANATTVEHWACCECHTAWADEARTIILRDGGVDKTRSNTKYQLHNYYDKNELGEDVAYGWEDNTKAIFDSRYGFSYTHELKYAANFVYLDCFWPEMDFDAVPQYEIELRNDTTGFLQVNVLNSNWSEYDDLLGIINILPGESAKILIDKNIVQNPETGSAFVIRLHDNYGQKFSGTITVSKPTAPVKDMYGEFQVYKYGDSSVVPSVTREETAYGRAEVFTADYNTEIYFRETVALGEELDGIKLHIFNSSSETLNPKLEKGVWGNTTVLEVVPGWNTFIVDAEKWNSGSILIYDLKASVSATFKLVIGEIYGLVNELNALSLPKDLEGNSYFAYYVNTVKPVLNGIAQKYGASMPESIVEKYNYFNNLYYGSGGFGTWGIYGSATFADKYIDGVTYKSMTNVTTHGNGGADFGFGTTVALTSTDAERFLVRVYNPLSIDVYANVHYGWTPVTGWGAGGRKTLAPGWNSCLFEKSGFTTDLEIDFIITFGDVGYANGASVEGEWLVSPAIDYVYNLETGDSIWGAANDEYLESRLFWKPVAKILTNEGISHKFSACNTATEDPIDHVTQMYIRGRKAIDASYSGVKVFIKNTTTTSIWLSCGAEGLGLQQVGGIPNNGEWTELIIDAAHWNVSGHAWLNFGPSVPGTDFTGTLEIKGFIPVV